MLATQFNPSADDNSQYLSGQGYDYALMKLFFDNLNTQMSVELAELGNADRLEATIMYGSETLQVYVQKAHFGSLNEVVINAEGVRSASQTVQIAPGDGTTVTARTLDWIAATQAAITACCTSAGLFFTPRWGSSYTIGESPLFEVPA
jgi:hypothetical protein